jgi:hypothetical protein
LWKATYLSAHPIDPTHNEASDSFAAFLWKSRGKFLNAVFTLSPNFSKTFFIVHSLYCLIQKGHSRSENSYTDILASLFHSK